MFSAAAKLRAGVAKTPEKQDRLGSGRTSDAAEGASGPAEAVEAGQARSDAWRGVETRASGRAVRQDVRPAPSDVAAAGVGAGGSVAPPVPPNGGGGEDCAGERSTAVNGGDSSATEDTPDKAGKDGEDEEVE